MQRLCPRCRHAVSFEEDGALVYCANCGAAQVRVAEELLEQADAARAGLDTSAAAAPDTAANTAGVNWPGAIRCAALAGAMAMGLTLASLGLPAVGLLSMFWAIGAPVVMMGVYVAKFKTTRILPGFGARLGLLCGLAVLLGSGTVNTAALLVERFGIHKAAEMDAAMNSIFLQFQTQLQQQAGAAAAAPTIAWLNAPDARAGALLGTVAFAGALYLVLSAAGGAFAGLLRAKKPAA